jgi:hypothetical protein
MEKQTIQDGDAITRLFSKSTQKSEELSALSDQLSALTATRSECLS